LPTSLIYIILSTRGCSPWRPAAVMSTTWRENYSFPRIFKGRRGRTGPRKGAGLCRPGNPSSGQTDFRVGRPLRRKENSSQGPRRRLRVQLRCRGESTSRCRNINRLPFRPTAHSAPFQTELPYVLGSTNPCPTAVHMEPFPTSVLKALI
jgi:hypothetical protein